MKSLMVSIERPGSVPLAPVRGVSGERVAEVLQVAVDEVELVLREVPEQAGRIVDTSSKVIRAMASGAAARTSLICASKLVSPVL